MTENSDRIKCAVFFSLGGVGLGRGGKGQVKQREGLGEEELSLVDVCVRCACCLGSSDESVEDEVTGEPGAGTQSAQ